MVVGSILGVAGRILAQKYLSKKSKTFLKRKGVMGGILDKDYKPKYIGKIKKKLK